MIERIRNKLDKIEKWEVLGFIFNILIFLVGFGIGGIYLIANGFDESNYISIILGIIISSIGFGFIFNVYFSNIKWLNFFIYIPAIIIGIIAITSVVGIAIIPFSSKVDLKIDLGILILKDSFVRFALIILDFFLAFKLFTYAKNRIRERKRIKLLEVDKKTENKKMNKSDLEIQKKLVEIFMNLEKEIELNNSETNKLGWQQRNELITHVNSEYDNHNNLNSKRNEWDDSVKKGNVLKWVYDLFKERRDLYGYFENYKEIELNLENLKTEAIQKEKYKIANYINEWIIELPK
ncbi:hypothetical protein H9W90_09940 [Polaribacter pectinis]|uniref:Uncharacterized protein n=1 Tax=Polaribacter pectinis TaxID=2738844 RepID=A0A7G9L7B7_9FLAO|nr:hypothetical protein [Polaribacter pectinis]QNM84516.1 hypothetical protein H9W90_09940 [Polaribacter pectinis]